MDVPAGFHQAAGQKKPARKALQPSDVITHPELHSRPHAGSVGDKWLVMSWSDSGLEAVARQPLR